MLSENENLILDTFEIIINNNIKQLELEIPQCEFEFQKIAFKYVIKMMEMQKGTVDMFRKTLGSENND